MATLLLVLVTKKQTMLPSMAELAMVVEFAIETSAALLAVLVTSPFA